jgi:hypothetical protein
MFAGALAAFYASNVLKNPQAPKGQKRLAIAMGIFVCLVALFAVKAGLVILIGH